MNSNNEKSEIEKLIKELIKEQFKPLIEKEKEIQKALKVLKSIGVYEIKLLDGRCVGVDYLLSFKHSWDEEEK